MAGAARRSLVRLTRRFRNKLAVDALSLEVAAGELVALMGASGSGKTTTLRMVAGYEDPDSGRGWLEGKDSTARAARERGVGVGVPQAARPCFVTSSAPTRCSAGSPLRFAASSRSCCCSSSP